MAAPCLLTPAVSASAAPKGAAVGTLGGRPGRRRIAQQPRRCVLLACTAAVLCFGAALHTLSLGFAGALVWRPSRTQGWRRGGDVSRSMEASTAGRAAAARIRRHAARTPFEVKYLLTGDDRVDVSQLQIGEAYEGTVLSRYHDKCLYVDIGARLPGMVTAAECQDGFPMQGFTVKPGDKVNVRVLDIAGGKFYLTMRRGDLVRPKKERITNGDLSAFRELDSSEWLEGEVADMSMFGVYVKVQTPGGGPYAVGLLHKNDFRPEFVAEAVRGGKVKVRVQVIVKDQLTFTMKDP